MSSARAGSRALIFHSVIEVPALFSRCAHGPGPADAALALLRPFALFPPSRQGFALHHDYHGRLSIRIRVRIDLAPGSVARLLYSARPNRSGADALASPHDIDDVPVFSCAKCGCDLALQDEVSQSLKMTAPSRTSAHDRAIEGSLSVNRSAGGTAPLSCSDRCSSSVVISDALGESEAHTGLSG